MNSETCSETTGVAFRDHPLVSVIVVTYQRPALLRRALDSVLAQTFRDMEVWCVHDGPPDEGTLALFEEYTTRFTEAGLDFYPTATDEHSGYYCAPRNVATENCRGVYVANLDDDNEWLPEALTGLVEAIEEGENWPDLVYGRREYHLTEDAPKEFHGQTLKEGVSDLVAWDDDSRARLAVSPIYNFIDSSDFIVSKGMLYRLAVLTGRLWNEDRRRFGDWDLVARLAWMTDCKFKALDRVVQRYWVHGQNVSLTRPVEELPRERSLYAS